MANSGMNHGGIWPTVAANDEDKPIDFANGIPEYQDAIAPETLRRLVFLAGLMVSLVGVSMLDGPLGLKLLIAGWIGIVTRWASDRVEK